MYEYERLHHTAFLMLYGSTMLLAVLTLTPPRRSLQSAATDSLQACEPFSPAVSFVDKQPAFCLRTGIPLATKDALGMLLCEHRNNNKYS